MNVCLLKVVQISFSRLVKVVLNFISKITIHMPKCDLFSLSPQLQQSLGGKCLQGSRSTTSLLATSAKLHCAKHR